MCIHAATLLIRCAHGVLLFSGTHSALELCAQILPPGLAWQALCLVNVYVQCVADD